MIEILRLQPGLGVLQKTAHTQMLHAVLKTCLLLNIFSKEINEMFILIPFIFFLLTLLIHVTRLLCPLVNKQSINGSRVGAIFPITWFVTCNVGYMLSIVMTSG